MAERQPAKAKKRTASRSAAGASDSATTAASRAPPASRIAELERERDRLMAELEAAKAKIKSLEQARDQALNHIDWVIDSLHSLRQD